MDLTPFKTLYNSQIDVILSNTGLTIPSTLVFENTKLAVCPNCIYDTLSQKSSNRYKVGGPIPFSTGQTCPFCLGAGTSQLEAAQEQVHFAVLTDSNHFLGVINLPEIEAQTICSISYIDKIKKCSRIIFNTDISNLTNNIFVRVDEPKPVGLGDSKYIFTSWKR
jgi:hypothetical protein